MQRKRVGIGLTAAALTLLVLVNIWPEGRDDSTVEMVPSSAAAPEKKPLDAASSVGEGVGEAHVTEALGSLVEAEEARATQRALVEAEHEEQFTFSGSVGGGPPLSDAFVAYGTGGDGSYDERRSLGRVMLDEDARFGPTSVELEDTAAFWFRLAGGGYVVEEVILPRPQPDASVELEFPGERGETMYFYVYDIDTEEPLDQGEATESVARQTSRGIPSKRQ